jgi:hypothetical protein
MNWSALKKKATRNQEINSKYSGTLLKIAEKLEKFTNFGGMLDTYSEIHTSNNIGCEKLY